MKENKKCWACKRTLVGDSKMRLCPGCINKYGSVGAAVAALGLAVGGRQLVKLLQSPSLFSGYQP